MREWQLLICNNRDKWAQTMPHLAQNRSKKSPHKAGNNTGSNVSNVVLFSGRAAVEVQSNNNHSYYHL